MEYFLNHTMRKSLKIIFVVILVWVFSPANILLMNNCQTPIMPQVLSIPPQVIPGYDPNVIAMCHSIAFTAIPGSFIWPPIYTIIFTPAR